jgi:excinuclease ABC subunit C
MDKLKKKVSELTEKPGVYLMKNASGKIIYVGKAKDLKKRVSSYFRNNSQHNEKVAKMVSLVDDFDYIVVDNEFEALVLECSLIKQHMPKYNILLKDDKGYHYILVSNEPYKKISAQMQKGNDGEYIGPFTSSYSVKQAVDDVNKVFMLPVCSRKFPEDIKKERPCLNYHIKQCYGACIGKVSQNEHNEIVNQAVEHLKGLGKETIKRLEKEMQKAAENLDFELAARLRDKIASIKKLDQKQKVVGIKQGEVDIIALSKIDKTSCAVVMKIRENRLVDKINFILNDSSEISDDRNSFIKSYYMTCNDFPKTIVVDADFEDKNVLIEYILKIKNKTVKITVPQKGELKKLVLMAKNNATEQLSHQVSKKSKEMAGLEELKELLGVEKVPNYIEAYDISNLGEQNVVGGMVVFENGKPLKKGYKKFKIKSFVGQDDYASMSEVVTRRLKRYFADEDSSFKVLPDLIFVDGGKGHVSTIKKVVEEFELDIPVFGMVKDSKHKTRAIAIDGGEIEINFKKSAFSLVTKIQDEVHRFAITFQRERNKKTMLGKGKK